MISQRRPKLTKADERACRHCGSRLRQKRGESRRHFDTRKFCDLACYRAGINRPCSVQGCDERSLARSLCSKHYARLRANGSPGVVRRMVGASLTERLTAYSRPEGDCLVWTGGTHRSGHGKMQVAGKSIGAHRVAFEVAYGPIPEDLVVRHKCDNPPCVNPSHLELGTHADNAQDRMLRGRGLVGESHPRSKLTVDQVREIRSLLTHGKTQSEIAQRFNVSVGAVSSIARRKTWSAVA